jgi:hypothetical protein
MKRLSILLILTLWLLTTSPGNATAYYANFDELKPNTTINGVTLGGMRFAGTDWVVRDMRVTGLRPFTLSRNALRGCTSALTITFDSPQRIIGFNFEINSFNSTDYQMTMTAFAKGETLSSANYKGALHTTSYRYPEGYALLATDTPFDSVTISENSPFHCVYIDNVATDTKGADTRLGQVFVTSPGTPLYGDAGGTVVRDANGLEMQIPNRTADNPGQDVFDVYDIAVVNGQVWVQLFVGSTASYPWVQISPQVQFLMYGS